MVKQTIRLGTALVAAAAFAAGPAAADTLQGFAGFAEATYTHSSFSTSGSLDTNTATFGAGMALPVADVPNLNWQVDASYGHHWTKDYTHFSPNLCHPPAASGPSCAASFADSAEIWNFGISPFLAYGGSRWGANLAYETVTHFGHLTNGGAFMEWYLTEEWTLAAKGGYLSSGGAPFGGHGHYLGAQAVFYPFPDLAVSGGVDWTDVVTNGSLAPFSCLHCQLDVSQVTLAFEGEWLPWEEWAFAVFGGYSHDWHNEFQQNFDEDIFHIGIRYYTGMGSLVDHHRNGNLRGWLRGS